MAIIFLSLWVIELNHLKIVDWNCLQYTSVLVGIARKYNVGLEIFAVVMIRAKLECYLIIWVSLRRVN